MVEFTKTIKDPLGLHARPVALLYDIIAKHRSDVSVRPPALRRSETSRSNLNNVTKGQSPLLHQLVWQGAAKRQSLRRLCFV